MINGGMGQQVNTAAAEGDYLGQTVSDKDQGYRVGVEAPAPAIAVLKDVSPDNGVTWFPADTEPGPNVVAGTNPQFRFTVTNTGNVTLNNVQITDDVYGLIGTVPSLAPGASAQFIVGGTWALGQQVNTTTATAQFVSASNPAYWVGVQAPAPVINVEKEVSPDNGVTWFDDDTPPGPNIMAGTNPVFRITLTNTGNVTLTGVEVTDDMLGLIGILPSLAPGTSFQWIVPGTWVIGQYENIVTAKGFFEGQTVIDNDNAYYFGAGPSIDLEKYISVDNGVTWKDADVTPGPLLPPGVSPQFKFAVFNNGSVTLTNIQVTDDVFGLIGTLPSLDPGTSYEWIITG